MHSGVCSIDVVVIVGVGHLLAAGADFHRAAVEQIDKWLFVNFARCATLRCRIAQVHMYMRTGKIIGSSRSIACAVVARLEGRRWGS
jgi:hypothetical protein